MRWGGGNTYSSPSGNGACANAPMPWCGLSCGRIENHSGHWVLCLVLCPPEARQDLLDYFGVQSPLAGWGLRSQDWLLCSPSLRLVGLLETVSALQSTCSQPVPTELRIGVHPFCGYGCWSSSTHACPRLGLRSAGGPETLPGAQGKPRESSLSDLIANPRLFRCRIN